MDCCNTPVNAVCDIEYRLREIGRTLIQYEVYDYNDQINKLIEKAYLIKKKNEIKQVLEDLEKMVRRIEVMEIINGQS